MIHKELSHIHKFLSTHAKGLLASDPETHFKTFALKLKPYNINT